LGIYTRDRPDVKVKRVF